jgi:hypothetical protein
LELRGMQLFLGDSMTSEDIPNGCETNPDDRTKILVAIEPRAYRSVVGHAIQILRPHLEVSLLAPAELGTEEVTRLDPALVISSRPKPSTSDGGPAWMEFRPYDEAPAKVCIGGRCARLYEPSLDDLLSVVDEAERFGRTPPEGPVALSLASYGNGGGDSWVNP